MLDLSSHALRALLPCAEAGKQEENEMIDLTDERFDGMLKCDGFDDAIIGVCSRCGDEDVLAYDENKVIRMLVAQGMTYEEAFDYFSFNIIGTHYGRGTPVFLDLFTHEVSDD